MIVKKPVKWTIAILLFAALVIFVADRIFLQNNITYSDRFGADCEYSVPEGYSVAYSKGKSAYTVKVTKDGEDIYLSETRSGVIQSVPSSIATPSRFRDSCIAKAVLKSYLKD